MGIGIGHVRFDVEDRGAIHQIGTFHNDNRSKPGIHFHPVKLYARKTEAVGAEGGTGGEDAETHITAQTWRTNGETLNFELCARLCRLARPRTLSFRELPDEPEIIEILKPANGLCLPVFWYENDASRQLTDKSALPRNTELRLQRRFEIRYRLYLHQGAKLHIINKKLKFSSDFFVFSKISCIFAQKISNYASNMKRLILLLSLTIVTGFCLADDPAYMKSKEYLALRNEMHHAFNDGDSARFFPAVKNLEEYLLEQNDIHAYYNQRCNEIVFEMNQQRIYEAYKMGRELSKELREKGLDKEMYMAMNMQGHINRYCGNKEEAKENWYEALRMLEKEGYYSNMPPLYMNIVNVALDDSPSEADSLLTIARDIALKYSPERVFDIETRQTLSYFYRGDMDRFLKGYEAYKAGEKEGKSSVHGRSMEVYYLVSQGKIDEAVAKAKKELGDEGKDAITQIYEKAGRWQEAYRALKEQTASSDSIDNVVLTNSVMGIRDELMIYEAQRETYRTRFIFLSAAIALLLLLILALTYIVQTRRKHMKELEVAYRKAMESEKMKAQFIQNVSHEVRTPLNIISGFSQVIADPELTNSVEERQNMSKMMIKSAQQITTLIDEIIGLSLLESTDRMKREDTPRINRLLKETLESFEEVAEPAVKLKFESTLSDDFTIKTNENMLKRIVVALTENATKYTKEGSIILKAEKDDNLLTITVEDTGCGIPKKDAEKVFERFVKLDSFKQGIGLGLPLSRKLAEQLGGTLTLDTSYTNGARFKICLPITEE